MQRGVSIWKAAGLLSMSPKLLQDTCGHRQLNHLRGAAAAIGQKIILAGDSTGAKTEKRPEADDDDRKSPSCSARPLGLAVGSFSVLGTLRRTASAFLLHD
jgi:hypothetical protein